MTGYIDPGRCDACGDRMTFGPHYHEPTCPGCGADLLDGIGSDADDDPLGLDDDGRTYCGSCGQDEPVHGWAAAEHRRRGNRTPPRPAPLSPDELDDPVTVAMIAERCGVAANSLVSWKRSNFPPPAVEGARGVAAWWEWADVAAWLETNRPTYLTEYQRRTNP